MENKVPEIQLIYEQLSEEVDVANLAYIQYAHYLGNLDVQWDSVLECLRQQAMDLAFLYGSAWQAWNAADPQGFLNYFLGEES